MSLDVNILGKNRKKLELSDNGEILAIVQDFPDVNNTVIKVPFVQRFTNNSDSFDMKVNPAPSEEFYIKSSIEADFYVNSILVYIADNGSSLNEFGAVPALSNGLNFEYKTQETGTIVLAESLKDNFSFVKLANGLPAFGTGTNAFKADQSGAGTQDSYIPTIYFEQIFGIKNGLRIRKNTNDALIFRVNDNTTGVDEFYIEAKGYKIIYT